MKYVKTDSNHSFYIEFMVDNELVTPDTGTVTATLTKPDGTVLSGYDAVAVTPDGDSYTVFTVGSSANGKTNDYELRHLEIYFEYNSKPHTILVNYNIVDRINIPVTEDEVRAVLGISVDEWPDDNIDIIKAYYDLQEEEQLESIDVDSTLEGGTSIVRNLIEAIKLKAALNIIPVLQIVVVQSQQADNTLFRRFEEVDFEAIRNMLIAEYSHHVSLVAGEDSVTLTYTTTGVGTDAVTGE